MTAVTWLWRSMSGRLFTALYDAVRRTPSLNYLAHRVTQGEMLHRLGPTRAMYKRYIRRKAERYLLRPPRLEITLTDACNARCIMCPPEVHLGETIMNRQLFERIVREAEALGIRKMVITGGEPLLDKGVADKIAFAKAHGFEYVHMFTNGSLMDERRARAVISSGLDSLTWSVDSARKEEYEKIRINLSFDTVIANLRRFVSIRAEMGLKRPLTRVNLVTLPQNLRSRKAFRGFFAEFVDLVEIVDSHNFADNPAEIVVDQARAYTQKTRYPCHLLFQKVVVQPDGKVSKCGIDFGQHSVVGDLSEQSLGEVLHSERVLDVKKNHLDYVFSDLGCASCTHKESWLIRD